MLHRRSNEEAEAEAKTSLGHLLRRRRTQAGVSMKDLADALQMKITDLSAIEIAWDPFFEKGLWPTLCELVPTLKMEELVEVSKRTPEPTGRPTVDEHLFCCKIDETLL